MALAILILRFLLPHLFTSRVRHFCFPFMDHKSTWNVYFLPGPHSHLSLFTRALPLPPPTKHTLPPPITKNPKKNTTMNFHSQFTMGLYKPSFSLLDEISKPWNYIPNRQTTRVNWKKLVRGLENSAQLGLRIGTSIRIRRGREDRGTQLSHRPM